MYIFKNKTYIDNRNYKDDENDDAEFSPFIPDGLWFKCEHCQSTIYIREVTEDNICPKCKCYFRMSARDRIKVVTDKNSFIEFDENLKGTNCLDYPNYDEKLEKMRQNLDVNEAVVTGICTIDGIETMIGVMDSQFVMGSMGVAVGEKITRLFEFATDHDLPVVLFTASGGARMQEGIISLMQMAKISMAVRKHSDAGLLYITFITDPTTGGVTASFAMLGDIILAEPRALIGFAGKRVIEQTINQKLPDDFQSAEMMFKNGFIDKIVPREKIKETLSNILKLHGYSTVETTASNISEVIGDQNE